MKKTNYLLLLSAVVMLVMASCGKEGATGPIGSNGPAGPVGPAGANGSVIYSGTTTPPGTTGALGDFYLDLTTGQLFGPKTATGWGTAISLKGGAGAAGSKIYNGSGVPASSLGVAGDYYLDKTNHMLYGPKVGTDWGTPLSLGGDTNFRSDVVQLGGTDWLWSAKYRFTINGSTGVQALTRYYVYNSSYLTSAVLANGLVLVYFTPDPVSNPNQSVPLPYSISTPFGYNFNYVYVTSPGAVTLEYFFLLTGANNTAPDLSTYNDIDRLFKIVIIDGQARALIKNNHIDVNDYRAVSRVTGLWQRDKLK